MYLRVGRRLPPGVVAPALQAASGGVHGVNGARRKKTLPSYDACVVKPGGNTRLQTHLRVSRIQSLRERGGVALQEVALPVGRGQHPAFHQHFLTRGISHILRAEKDGDLVVLLIRANRV